MSCKHVTWSFDGANENTGGEDDAFCGNNALFYRMFISRNIWKHVDDKLDKAGVGKPLDAILLCQTILIQTF